ncbi:hypothetical protein M1N11_01945 [Peptococcaceae bacterium]|nr:hypothetical protein [Peptococcaceae bacterium]
MSGAADKVLLELQKRIEKTCSKHRKEHRKDEIGRICAFVGKSMETVLD